MQQVGAGSSPPWGGGGGDLILSFLLGGGGGQPWLQRLLGNSVAPQVGSIFNQAVWDNTARRWNAVNVRRTTKSDAANHLSYCATNNNLVAARCTTEPLVVMARNRVFLCILQCCRAMRRLFLAFFVAKLGYHPLYVQRRYKRFRLGTGMGCCWRNTTPHRQGDHNLFWV